MASIAIDQANAYSLMAKVQETGVPDLAAGTFHLALMGTGFAFDASHTTWADVKAHQIDDVGIAGYDDGGKAVVFDGGGRFGYNTPDTETFRWTFPATGLLRWLATIA